jgi:cytochrome c-type protein NapB
MSKSLLLALAAALSCGLVFAQGKAVTERDMGLSRTDVFETPAQQPYALDAGRPRPAPLGTPPVIVHSVESMLPIKADANQCLTCHDKPAQAGKRVVKGQPQPMPDSHYLRTTGGRSSGLNGAYYECMLCHAPQANVAPLVGTTSR